ncbi:MAG: hypothetical protein KAV87_35845 [Desulfobacteraceae bacterium]|nr:hypothetical protein [Desulfobacteraceae bacterium]
MMQKIRFQNKEYLFLDGVIATEEQCKRGEISYALLRGNNVLRHNEIIGHIDDIEYLDEIEDIKPDSGAWLNMLNQQVSLIAGLPMAEILRKVKNSKGNGKIKFRRYGETT